MGRFHQERAIEIRVTTDGNRGREWSHQNNYQTIGGQGVQDLTVFQTLEILSGASKGNSEQEKEMKSRRRKGGEIFHKKTGRR